MKKNNLLFIFICAIVIFALSPLRKVEAADKNIDVNIDKDYSSCTFKIDFETPGDYAAQ